MDLALEEFACFSLSDAAVLAELPTELQLDIYRQLSARDLATLSVQSKALRGALDCDELWEPLCKARWPAYRQTCGASWCQAYRRRAVLPAGFLAGVDQACEAQQLAVDWVPGRPRDPRRDYFNTFMQALFQACVEAGSAARGAGRAEYERLRSAALWWLHTHPQEPVRFVRQANTRLQAFDMWQAAFVNWADTPWRRSAVAFLQSLASGEAWALQSVLARVTAEAAALDSTIRSLVSEEEPANLIVRVPPGVPAEHWWFFLGEQEPSRPQALSCHASHCGSRLQAEVRMPVLNGA